MFRKRRRKTPPPGSEPGAAAANPASDPLNPSPVAPGVSREAKGPPLLAEAFKGAIEKAADRAKTELAAKGKLESMVFFVHDDGTMKIASLSPRDGRHKELLIRRIREKALAESAYAVMALIEIDPKRHKVVLSGVTPGAKASVHLDYTFDAKTKTVTSWELKWLNQPVQNPFLNGIFDEPRRF
jgi:hypothetical protein